MFLPQEEIITCWPGQRQREEVLTFSDVQYKLGQGRSAWSQTISCQHTPKKNRGVLILLLLLLHYLRISYSLLTIRLCNNKRDQNSLKKMANFKFKVVLWIWLSEILDLICWAQRSVLLPLCYNHESTYFSVQTSTSSKIRWYVYIYIYPLVFDRPKYAKRSLEGNVIWCRNLARSFLLQL